MNSGGAVYIVDDDSNAAGAMSALFASVSLKPRCFASSAEFLKAFCSGEPCCVILEMRMPELGGLEVLARLNRRPARPPALIVTAHGGVSGAVRAMKLGAADFLEKPVNEQLLLEVVQHWIGVDRAEREHIRACGLIQEKLASLSAREHEVLLGLVDGCSNKEMARELGVSPKAIEIYRSKLMIKMAAQSLSGLLGEVLCCPGRQCKPLQCRDCHDASAAFRQAIKRRQSKLERPVASRAAICGVFDG